jgi:hypothetical protein
LVIVYLACGPLYELAQLERWEPPGGFYDRWRASPERQALWRAVCRWTCERLGEPLYWQRVPTFRHVRAGSAGYPLHREADFGHNRYTVNLWAPLVPALEGALLFGEVPGPAPRHSRAIGPGQCILFPGNMPHGSPEALEADRWSIDARFLPERAYVDTEARSAVAGVRLAVGAYYGHPRDLA